MLAFKVRKGPKKKKKEKTRVLKVKKGSNKERKKKRVSLKIRKGPQKKKEKKKKKKTHNVFCKLESFFFSCYLFITHFPLHFKDDF